ncbi:hypothetical protein BHYA_0102g00050 [Botrytis hyacinthi]|uniref:Uncharacterized protein n=1 Tax=Botrytis hyacinthi TaxID=278943 RepID=A0A4Z1GPL8_9HELO|nr:hypothetical protein BHYA_0102g00050 [Botrytis hyacinthi]
MREKQPSSHTQNTISSELSSLRIFIEFTSSSSVESQTRKEPQTKEVQKTMEHNGPLAPWKIEEQAKRKVTHSAWDNVQRPEVLTVSIFSSQYILGYNVENRQFTLNPNRMKIQKQVDLTRFHDCPPGLNYKLRKHWHHQKKFYVKLTGMQGEWVGISDEEEGPAEGSEDESEHVAFIGLADEIDDRPMPFPRIEKLRTSKNTSSEDENVAEVTGHHRVTDDADLLSSHVVKSVVARLRRDLSHSRKVHKRLSPPTDIGKLSRYRLVRKPVRFVKTARVAPKDTPLRLRVQRRQERSNSTSYHAAPPNLSQSNTRRPSPIAFFSALGQHPPAPVFVVAASPTRVLPIIDSSLSVAASSTNIGGGALDDHLISEFPPQVQLFDSIAATALQTPFGRPAIASNTSMQMSLRPSPDGTIDEIIDADNPLVFNIHWYSFFPRTKLLELQEMCLHHLFLTFLAIVSGDSELSNDPDLELGGLDLLFEHGIQLD